MQLGEDGAILANYELVSKAIADEEVLKQCPPLTHAVRYDLAVGENEAVPALIVFVLTILSGLLALFVIFVLHYNCMINVKGRAPYRLPWICSCTRSPCELYFPVCVDEDSIRELLIRKEQKKMAGMYAQAGSQYTGQSGLPINAFNLDMRSNRSDSIIIDSPSKGKLQYESHQ